jgi:DNA-damage-inducible protein J
MSKSAMIRARVEPNLKERAEATLDELGLSPTTAITLFYRQIIRHRGLPFEVRIPNAATRRAMHDARTGRDLIRAGSTEELLAKLNAENETRPAPARKRKVRGPR